MRLIGGADSLIAVGARALLLAACVLTLSSPALAHGVIQTASPPANTVLTRPVPQVVLRFNEAIDPAFSSVTVTGPGGGSVSQPAVFSQDSRTVTLRVEQTERGLYTVRWRALSLVDGHTTAGSYVYSLGQPLAQGTVPPGQTDLPSPLRIALRWLTLLAALALAGSAFFWFVVVRPAARGMEAADAQVLRDGARQARFRLTSVAAPLLAASVVAEVLVEMGFLLELPPWRVPGSEALWPLLGGTRLGWSAAVRLAMAVLLMAPPSPRGRILQAVGLVWFLIAVGLAAVFGGPVSAFSGPHVTLLVLATSVYGLVGVMTAVILPQVSDVVIPELDVVPAVAGAVLLTGFTISAHASGQGAAAMLADWAHLLAAAVWIGGLTVLLLMFRSREISATGHARALVPRFSSAAALSLITLVITGLYSTWLNVPEVRAFLVTAYGRVLSLKLLLVLPMIALGALNHFVLRPRLAGGAARTAFMQFIRAVTGEVGLGAAILLTVAVLTILPQAKVALPPPPPEPIVLTGIADDVRLDLRLSPARAGWNRYEVTARTIEGDALATDARVMLRLIPLQRDELARRVVLDSTPNLAYIAEGGELADPGWWEVEVIVRRRGRLDVSTNFPLLLGDVPRGGPDPAVELLKRAHETMENLRSWHEQEQLTDGSGNVVVTRYEFLPPDRLHYVTGYQLPRRQAADRGEAIIIGATRYFRTGGGAWAQDTLPQPIVAAGARLYLQGAEGIIGGRQEICSQGESCRAIMWTAPGGDPHFAGWIGLTSGRLHRVMMVTRAHYMSSRLSGFNAPVRIDAPR